MEEVFHQRAEANLNLPTEERQRAPAVRKNITFTELKKHTKCLYLDSSASEGVAELSSERFPLVHDYLKTERSVLRLFSPDFWKQTA